jgi:lysophospholipase L1-like esterase
MIVPLRSDTLLSKEEETMSHGPARHLISLETLVIALPFAVGLYPAIALLMNRSEIPIFFNMYSRELLLLNAAIVLSYVGMFIASWYSWRGAQFAAILLIALLMLVAITEAVRNLPLFEVMTQLVRIPAGLSLILVAFLATKQQGSRWSGIGLTVGTVVLITGLIDLPFSLQFQLFGSKESQILSTYRTTMDLGNVSEEDIVLVGDSNVWGAGVSIEQRFGDVLERKLGGPRVYSLGKIGANVGGYDRQILDIPASKRVKHVFVLFCDNDMPPRADLRDTLEKLSFVIRFRSVTTAVLIDFVRFIMTPSPEVYSPLLLDSYAEEDKTFEVRWSLLEHQLRSLYQKATERSLERPTLVILPELVDFPSSFDQPHRRVAELAQQIGFRALDSTPVFLSVDENLKHFRAAENDTHLNARGNVVMAEVLLQIIKDGSVAVRP